MAEVAPYTVVPGTLSATPQPTLSLDGGAVLRPWADGDAPALRTAYADPGIQRWHVRELDSLDEARETIVAWRAAWAKE